jgi:hypothetical protein
MLDRAKQPSADRRRERNSRHRQRCRAGRMVPLDFDVNREVIDMLVRTRWLADRDAGDRHAIGRALRRMLESAAK